ncbi:hypothetical protein FT663_02027 [Candidozyma haemuli var. vulneris]|uniref:Small ribosomal subunit protein mS38 n=1 Tax=Candidozyma haemuli TaxID=45357 RepID=A0A2V1AMF7_9ASCO|nr:hypothetical protein CXQ85_001257 [[Candida] haemuloni]KAF3991841.1 hypothetical protein FT662_01458 [[Candida] haemuloni var. vulneris]KAF3993196.1 hypothetical protein FT663_02027 [[Candida] haemuloni var. vulneris]PVH18965.1 hypothetical protein CXQ85_001257 [[Candida] haemuloni]
MFRLPQLRQLTSLTRGIGARSFAAVARPQLPVLTQTNNVNRFGFGTTETLQLPQSWNRHTSVNTISMLELPKDVWEQQAEKESDVTDNTVYADSVKRKRKLKMKKHKLRKRRKLGRALLKRLGKVKD